MTSKPSSNYTRAAEQGHAAAQFNLALMYDEGEGVPVDDLKAIDWYQRRQSLAMPMRSTTWPSCMTRARVCRSTTRAAEYYLKAAEQGHADAQYNLALLYDHGEGVALDDREAVRWYTAAAEQGDASAQYNLAIMYDEGEGVPVDDRRAIEWYRKAAEQGHADAQYNLALMYDEGEGTKVDDAEAINWYTFAAEQGHASAQYNLALMYDEGEGTPEDNQAAIRWYTAAAGRAKSTPSTTWPSCTMRARAPGRQPAGHPLVRQGRQPG
ncbi:tetratricopeptide repeat protein [Halopseudomonas pachastrellae]|nr:tetratricopeptide repeat protein [Halopseudomonas pachastrellae]